MSLSDDVRIVLDGSVPATAVKTSLWCQVLSTEMHHTCRWGQCMCPCHMPPNQDGKRKRRPHSYPRVDWRHNWAPGTAEKMKRQPVEDR